MINVLIVEDSPVVREFLIHILSADPGIHIIGTARDGEEALAAVRRHRPDVITMDIHMPKMNGLEATRRIMETDPIPIVIVSGSSDPREVATTFDAMDAGALAVLRRPEGIGHPLHEAMAGELVQTVKLMSEVKVVRRWPLARREAMPAGGRTPPDPVKTDLPRESARVRIAAIGASTGGPPVLQTILAALPKDFPVPVVIVQHMTTGFVQGFVEWLAQSATLSVRLAGNGEFMLPGHAYVAPDECQMKVTREGRIAITKDEPENGLRPSVSYLFRSIADYYRSNAVAGLLSGMGRDGAEELRLLKEKGAITFVQDKDSSVVHGMPGAAIRLNAAMLVLPPEKIADVLISIVNNSHARGRYS